MAGLDAASQHVHDKGELSLYSGDRDELFMHAFICIYIYVCCIHTYIHLTVLSIFET